MNHSVTSATLAMMLADARPAPSRPDLSFRALASSQLPDVDLSGVDLVGAKFTDSDLTGARFHEADCTQARFEGARLNGASFVLANCAGADFAGADLRGADFEQANLSGARGILTISGVVDVSVVAYATCDGWMVQLGKTGAVHPREVRARLETGTPDGFLDGLGFRSDYELRAVLDLVEAWAAARPALLAAVQKWAG